MLNLTYKKKIVKIWGLRICPSLPPGLDLMLNAVVLDKVQMFFAHGVIIDPAQL
jgi:hypothetical protein